MRQKINIDKELPPTKIAEDYGVSAATAWRAKKRGWLWKNYHGEDNSPPVKKGVEQKFLRIIRIDALNESQFTSLSRFKITDVQRGRSRLKENEWQVFKAELVELRNMLRRFVKSEAGNGLEELTEDARLKKHLIFNKKMIDRLHRGYTAYDEEIKAAQEKVQELLNKTIIK